MKSGNVIQEKSFAFALEIVALYQQMAQRHEYVLSKQLLRAGTSIGANVEEALAAQSRRDFLAKMAIASKEARETCYWLRLLQASRLAEIEVGAHLALAEELVRLLTAIVKTTAASPAPGVVVNSKLKIKNCPSCCLPSSKSFL